MSDMRRLLVALLALLAVTLLGLAPRLRDRLPIALSSVAALRQGQHAFDALDRYGETDGAWRAPRNLWQNATATTWACDRIIGGKAAAGCLDLGMNALAPMGPRGWARTFLRGDIKMLMNPLTRYYYHGDASASSNMLLPCGWTSPTDRSTLIFSFGPPVEYLPLLLSAPFARLPYCAHPAGATHFYAHLPVRLAPAPAAVGTCAVESCLWSVQRDPRG